MSVTIQPVNVNTNNFLDWVAKTNLLIAAANNMVSTGSNTAVGVAGVLGTLYANNMYMNVLYGGTFGAASDLTVATNTAFSSNISLAGSNNSLGSISNVFATGSNTLNRVMMSNNVSGRLYFGNLNTEIQAIDGTGSGLDADLVDGLHAASFAQVSGGANAVFANAISFGSALASSNSSLTRHVSLFSTTYGFNVTSSTMNYVAASGATHQFIINTTPVLKANVAAITAIVPIVAIAANTTATSINIPHGTAPSAPANGDFWSTTAGWFVRTNGSTQQLLTMTYLLTVDGAGSSLDADLLDGQEGAYYSNVTARLGYTPANDAGDIFTGNVSVSSTAPAYSLNSTGSGTTVTFFNNSGVLQISGTNTIDRGIVRDIASTANVTTVAATLIHQFPKATYRGAKYVFSIKNNNANAFSMSEMLVAHHIGDAFLTEYAVLHTNTSFGAFSANTDSSNVRIYFTATSNSAVVTFDSTLLPV